MSERYTTREDPPRIELTELDEGLIMDSFAMAMEHIDVGCVIVSIEGECLWSNRLGAQQLSYRVEQAGEELALWAALGDLVNSGGIEDETLVLMPRGCCERPIEALILPHAEGYVVMLADPDQLGEGFASALMKIYEFTQTEAEVAQWLASGLNVHEIATLFENSPYTIRTHIRNILKKCALNDQRALIGLLLRGIARCY